LSSFVLFYARILLSSSAIRQEFSLDNYLHEEIVQDENSWCIIDFASGNQTLDYVTRERTLRELIA
jgi:hypothetical protein